MIEGYTYTHICSRLMIVRCVEGGKPHLLSYTRLCEKTGVGVAERLVYAAFYSGPDKWLWKSRKGFKIDFYQK